MDEIKITKEKFLKVKDIVIFVLLALWIFMPVLQSFRIVYKVVRLNKCYFALMRIIGGLGIGLGIYNIYDKIKTAKDKKEIIKQLLPIFLFVIYMIWTFIACIFSPNRNLAFEGSMYRQEGYLMYINYAGFFLSALFLESKKLKQILLNLFVAVSVFLISVAGITFQGDSFRKIFVNNSIETTVFAQFNHYGYYLMMTLICSFGLFITQKNKILKTLYIIAYAIICAVLIYNNTFGCYLSAAVMLIVATIYALIKKKHIIPTLIAILIFVLLSVVITKDNENLAYKNISGFAKDIRVIVLKMMNIEVEDENIDKEFEKAGTSRMALWKNGVKFIFESPIIGYGPENLREKYRLVGITQDRPHNLIIQLATTSGIPGMLLYMTAVGIIIVREIKKILKNKKTGTVFLLILVAYLISAMFGNSMYYTSPYFFIWLGCLMNCNFTKNEET